MYCYNPLFRKKKKNLTISESKTQFETRHRQRKLNANVRHCIDDYVAKETFNLVGEDDWATDFDGYVHPEEEVIFFLNTVD